MASQQAELAAKVTEQGAAVADATAKLALAKAESAKISAKLSADNLQRTDIDRSGPSAADALSKATESPDTRVPICPPYCQCWRAAGIINIRGFCDDCPMRSLDRPEVGGHGTEQKEISPRRQG